MGYRNKEECLIQAERLGIDIAGMTWPQLQKAVKEALLKEQLGLPVKKESLEENKPVEEPKAKIQKPKKNKSKTKFYFDQLVGQKIMTSPELAPDVNRAIHYEEELGDDLIVDEKYYDIRNLDPVIGERSMATGTYVIKGKTGRKVIAESALPKENPGESFTFGKDWVHVLEVNGKRGYRWTEVKYLLQKSGYYHKYKNEFKQPYVWYARGIIAVDIDLTNHVFNQIMEEERKKRL